MTDQEQPIQVLNIPRGVLQAMVRQTIINELGGVRLVVQQELLRMVQEQLGKQLPAITKDLQARADQLIAGQIARQLTGWGRSEDLQKYIAKVAEQQASELLKQALKGLYIELDVLVKSERPE